MESTPIALPDEDFEHEPLPDPDHLRILTILPSHRFDDKLECLIESGSIDASTHYNALSYSWGMNDDGDATPNRILSISGRIKHVTQNLFEGLLRLREKSNPSALRVWVDAVCINQRNLDERTHQVARMGMIYKCAMRTMIWLGESGNPRDDSLVLAMIKCTNAGNHQSEQHVWHDEKGEMHEVCSLFRRDRDPHIPATEQDRDEDWYLVHSPPKLDSPEVHGEYEERKMRYFWKRAFMNAAAIFERRYFTRRWIFQELFHAGTDRLQVYWGSCECSVREIMQTGSCIVSALLHHATSGIRWLFFDGKESLVRRINKVKMMLDAALPPSYEPPTMERALCWAGHMECSDDRDLVYSLVSIDANLGLVPDYRLSCAETYTALARRFIETGRTHLIVNNCSGPTPKDLSGILIPSWVPDLRFPFDYDVKFSIPSIPELKPEISQSTVLSLSPNVHGAVQNVKHPDRVFNRFDIEIAAYRFDQSDLAALTNSDSPDESELLWHLIRENVIVPADDPSGVIVAHFYARPNQLLVEAGDVLCSLADSKVQSYEDLFILRIVDLRKAVFKLVCAIRTDEDPRSRREKLSFVRARLHLI